MTAPLPAILRDNPSAVLFEIERIEAKRSYRHFVEAAWPQVVPDAFVPGWHIDAICEHVEAVVLGKSTRDLLINVPPRHAKSTLVSVLLAPWAWIVKPSLRFVYFSYSEDLVFRDSIAARSLIASEWYRTRFPEVQISNKQDSRQRFDTTARGFRYCSTVLGTATGEGGDILIVDDPLSKQQAMSDTMRERVNNWWWGTISTRQNQGNIGARIIIMQRLHDRDLAGEILEREGDRIDHLCLPAEFERHHPTPSRTSLGFKDPRRKEGALLCPARFDREAIETLKRRLGPFDAAGQLQQKPTPDDGEFFKREWLGRFDWEAAAASGWKGYRFYGASDYATSDSSRDWTVHGLVGVTPDGFLDVVDWWREKANPDVWIDAFLDMVLRWQSRGEGIAMWGEEAGQIIRSLGPSIKQQMTERNVYVFRKQFASNTHTGNKQARARSIQARAAHGKVRLPRGAPWVEPLINELLRFPAGATDDQVDVMSLFGRMTDRMHGGEAERTEASASDRAEADVAGLIRRPTIDELFKVRESEEDEWRRI